MPELNLKGGVLIIGSLWWDPSREQWRQKYLNMDEVRNISLPIRYGRLSGSDRRYTHTMVFSSDCKDALGTGLVITFKEQTKNFDQLHDQVMALMAAEMKKSPEIDRYNWGWGMIALVINPNHLSVSSEKKSACRELKDYWQSIIGNGFNSDEYRVGKEKPIIDETGNLLIDWPEELTDYDFIIATATKPALQKYPSPEEIGHRMAYNDYRIYLESNIKHGISTFQDAEILAAAQEQDIDLLNALARASIPLAVVKPPNYEPLGFGSGCLVSYKNRQFLLSVEHVANIKGAGLCIMTYMPTTGLQTSLYSVGSTWYFDQYKLPKNALHQGIATIDDLDKFYDETLDITFCEIKGHVEMIQPEWVFPEFTIYKGPRIALTLETAGAPEKGKEYGFAGSIRHNVESASIKTVPTMKVGLTYGGRIGMMEYFISPDLIKDADDYRGCSGAPILDEEGKLVALAAIVKTGSKLIFGFSIQECRRLIDVTLLHEAKNIKD